MGILLKFMKKNGRSLLALSLHEFFNLSVTGNSAMKFLASPP
jgi:hypothetical protein